MLRARQHGQRRVTLPPIHLGGDISNSAFSPRLGGELGEAAPAGQQLLYQPSLQTTLELEKALSIGNKEPKIYFRQLRQQCEGGEKCYGNITAIEDLRENFRMNCIPENVTDMTADDYSAFLSERRKLMAAKLRQYFASL